MQNWGFIEWSRIITLEQYLSYKAENIMFSYIMLLVLFISSNMIYIISALYKYYKKQGEN